jgi:glycosyltransferase involved in cell wall biosynthesis
MAEERPALDIAYLHYGDQSQVTPRIAQALSERGHHVVPLCVPGPLELRSEHGRRRPTWRLAVGLAFGARRFGRHAFGHRWNTTFAFDVHTRRAEALVARLPRPPHVILQNGALFAPGRAPRVPYVLLLDHTRQLSMERRPNPEAGLPAPIDYGPGWRARETALYQHARGIATFSQLVARSLQDHYGVARERIQIVGGGANLHPEKVERRDDGRTLLFVGKDFQRKGGPILLRAFQRLHRQRPTLRLLIAGPRERLEGLPEGVSHLGFVTADKLTEVFSRATLFVLPTLREPYGLAFLDAMACGVPCIGTDVEAVPEVLDHGNAGVLVPPGDDAALAEAIDSLLDDPARTHALGLRGRMRVDGGFLWSHVADRLERALLVAAGLESATEDRERSVA